MLGQATGPGFTVDLQAGLQHLTRLDQEHEQIPLSKLLKFPGWVETAAIQLAPHWVSA